jgi:hypothetical protein
MVIPMATLAQAVITPAARIDAKPVLQRRPDGIWSRAETIRDQIHAAVGTVCSEQGLDALVAKSNPAAHPTWVKFECWVGRHDPMLTARTSATITIEPKPFHQFEFVYNITIDDNGKKTEHRNLVRCDKDLIRSIILHLLRHSTKPRVSTFQLRTWPWQLWRPQNKITALKRDWPALIPFIVGAIGLLTLQFGIGWVLLAGAALGFYFLSRRPVLVRSAGKPIVEPRSLIRADSWQTVVSGLGGDEQRIRHAFLRALDEAPITGLHHSVEHIWYWGLDGQEERDQLVVRFRRGIVYCQIHRYDEALYVGWDGQLNLGQWVEETVTQGMDRHSDCLARFTTVVPGTQIVTEYDITDLNCVMEWIHATLTQLLKKMMDERKIDQEIDFQILRGERKALTEAGKRESGARKTTGVMGRLRRTD